MSPNEFQLRSALRDGDGADLDPDAVLNLARRARHERRRNVGAVAGSVVAVLALATGVAMISHGGSDNASSGRAEGTTPQGLPTQSAPTSAGAASGAPSRVGGDTRVSCPSRVPRLATPPGTSFGAAETLLPANVTSVTVCVYQPESAQATPDTSGIAGSYTLTGAEAAALAAGLNQAPAKPGQGCTFDLGPSVVILGVGPSGTLPEIVGQAYGCGFITNGTAKRYSRDVLLPLIHRALPALSASARMTPGPGPS